MNDWIEHKTYWEHVAPQGTDEWKEARKGRVTASKNSALADRSSFSSPSEAGKIIAGVIEPEFDDTSQKRMDHGKLYEDNARDYYMKKYNCKVVERNLIVPKSDMWLGASVDGEVIGEDKIIEIKCPMKMYNHINTYLFLKNHGIPRTNFDHISPSHMDQMQQGMAILGKKWCDYIVYCTTENRVFVQKIPFNSEYWNTQLYPKLKENYGKYVLPHLKGKYPLLPSN